MLRNLLRSVACGSNVAGTVRCLAPPSTKLANVVVETYYTSLARATMTEQAMRRMYSSKKKGDPPEDSTPSSKHNRKSPPRDNRTDDELLDDQSLSADDGIDSLLNELSSTEKYAFDDVTLSDMPSIEDSILDDVPGPHDERIADLLSHMNDDDMSVDVGDFEDVDILQRRPRRGSTSDFDSSALPGHRIRGILVPTEETHSAMIAGQRFDQLPIAYIKSTYQNTLITITDSTGATNICHSSSGLVGFKNAKKKTTVAGHAAGLAAGQLARKGGYTHVRVVIRGIGKSRLEACKGLCEAGLEVVSLTDESAVDFGSNMPKKRRRI